MKKSKVSFKECVLRQSRRKDNTFSVYIRIGYRSKYEFIPTGDIIHKSELNKKLEIKSSQIKANCFFFITKFEERLKRANIEFFSVSDVVEYIQRDDLEDNLSYTNFYIKIISKLEEENSPSKRLYKTTYNHLCKFKSHLYVNEITPKMLSDFEKYLVNSGTGSRGVSIYLSRIRAVYNLMMDEYEDYGYKFKYPFRKYKIPKAREPKTVAITKENLLKIINYKSKYKRDELARDLFAISLLTLGTNASDLFDLKTGDRIEYKRNKTKSRRSDEAFISIKIEPELLPYMEKYKGKDGYVFNFRDLYKNKSQLNKAVCEGLISINKSLDIPKFIYYDARRTMASTMRNKLGISKDDVAVCLNHVDMDHKMTDIYIETDFSILDRCNRQFLDWLFKQK